MISAKVAGLFRIPGAKGSGAHPGVYAIELLLVFLKKTV